LNRKIDPLLKKLMQYAPDGPPATTSRPSANTSRSTNLSVNDQISTSPATAAQPTR